MAPLATCAEIQRRVSAVVFALGAIASLWIGACDYSGCANVVQETVASPDQRYKAVVFERDCGATTAISSQVSVLPLSDSLPNRPANVYIAKYAHQIGALWASEDHLILMVAPYASIAKQEHTYKDVEITYQEK